MTDRQWHCEQLFANIDLIDKITIFEKHGRFVPLNSSALFSNPTRSDKIVRTGELLSLYGKPKGLWVSVESDQDHWKGWREWCESELSALDKFEHAARIHLKGDAKIKLISDDNGIHEFNEQFSRPIPSEPSRLWVPTD